MISTRNLKNFSILATDGEIGKVEEFYFDDESWVLRYLVVNTGTWLTGRKVLISPIAIQRIDPVSQQVVVSLTRQKVADSPDIDTEKPLSRQMETRYYNYYRWPYYWGGMGIWGLGAYPPAMLDYPYSVPPGEEPSQPEQEEGDPHLRSFREVRGYRIEAIDAAFGHLEDLVFDEESWMVRYLVVDTVNFWPSKSVLIAPEWVKAINWSDRRVEVDLTEQEVKNSPEYLPGEVIGREYEESLYDYYRRPKYWTETSGAPGLKTADQPPSKRQIGFNQLR